MKDYNQAKDFLTRWWNDEETERPALLLRARKEPEVALRELPEIEGVFCPAKTTKSLDYRLAYHWNDCAKLDYLVDSVPAVRPYLGTATLAMFLGCSVHENQDTVWTEKMEEIPEKITFDPNHPLYRYQVELIQGIQKMTNGAIMPEFPDLLDGLDIVSALWGNEELLFALIDDGDTVKEAIRQIDDIYIPMYLKFYDLIKDERGGSVFWAWAPGKMVKQQCDFSAMISKEMYDEFGIPEIKRILENVDYAMYHLDGVAAIRHFDSVFSIPKIGALQWTPGAGQKPVSDPSWFPLYHRALDMGKKVYIYNLPSHEALAAFKKEFGKNLSRFMFTGGVRNAEDAQKMVEEATVL